eukprot:TRINITY_DN54_c0_g2_i1.p1 TRINITY_DN54_c0_g2~~TRINITY_DN54_c0_g2_i1.p1  ORF type:complete len:446 (-),score=60.05 TRINITY_DN54_c0_g2_i1:4585-5922(-)
MHLEGTGVVDFVGAVSAATLPSPARRCLLQFNAFLDTTERRCRFRPVAYVSPGHFRRVLMEGSTNIFPSDLHFSGFNSATMSGDSTWDFNSMASFRDGVLHSADDSGTNSPLKPEHEFLNNDENGEGCDYAQSEEDEITPVYSSERIPQQNGFRSTLCKNILIHSHSEKCNPAPHALGPAVDIPQSKAFQQKTQLRLQERKAEAEKRKMEIPVKKDPSTNGTTSVFSPSKLVRKISPTFGEGLAIIRRLTGRRSGNNSDRNDNEGSDCFVPSETPLGDVLDDNEVEKSKPFSKTGSLKKFLSPRGLSGESSSRSKSIRQLLRKTSKTLTSTFFEFGKASEGDAGQRGTSNYRQPMPHIEYQPYSQKRRSTSAGQTLLRRDMEEFAEAEERGSSSEPASLTSHKSGNQRVRMDKESMERYVNAALGEGLMKHTVDVEKYLDDVASP